MIRGIWIDGNSPGKIARVGELFIEGFEEGCAGILQRGICLCGQIGYLRGPVVGDGNINPRVGVDRFCSSRHHAEGGYIGVQIGIHRGISHAVEAAVVVHLIAQDEAARKAILSIGTGIALGDEGHKALEKKDALLIGGIHRHKGCRGRVCVKIEIAQSGGGILIGRRQHQIEIDVDAGIRQHLDAVVEQSQLFLIDVVGAVVEDIGVCALFVFNQHVFVDRQGDHRMSHAKLLQVRIELSSKSLHRGGCGIGEG